jgi:hypothetical protein
MMIDSSERSILSILLNVECNGLTTRGNGVEKARNGVEKARLLCRNTLEAMIILHFDN